MAIIVPAILTSDIKEAQKQLGLLAGLVELIQLDLMDGKFVDNTSISSGEITQLNSDIQLEAHLMVRDPDQWLSSLNSDLFKRIYFHIEAVPNPEKLIVDIKSKDIEPGIAINLDTPISVMENYIDTVDSVLFMSIQPGWQGQKFNPEIIEKIDSFINQYPEHMIAIDGGVNANNILDIIKVGVDNLSVGSAIFGDGRVKENLKKLTNIIS